MVQEMTYVSEESNRLFTSLDKKASDDSVQMGLGMILFWPALFFLEGDGPEAAEYAQLKGDFKALRKASIMKNCSVEAFPPSPEELIEEKKKKESSPVSEDSSSIL